jgi:hypothetical protein
MNLTVLLSSSADPESCLASVAPSGQAGSLCVLHSGQSSRTCSGVWSAPWHAHLADSMADDHHSHDYSADLPQHVKSAALLARAHCPKDQDLGVSGWPEENYQHCRVPRIEGLIGHDRTQKNSHDYLWILPTGIQYLYIFFLRRTLQGVKKLHICPTLAKGCGEHCAPCPFLGQPALL